LPVSRFDKLLDIARRVKRFLRNPKKTLRRKLGDPKDALRRRIVRSKKHEFKQVRSEIKSQRREEYKRLRNNISKIENELQDKRREAKRIAEERRTAEDPAAISEYDERRERVQQEIHGLRSELRATKKKARDENVGRKKSKKRAQQEIFQLEREIGAAKERRARNEETGALPDFVIIGERKCGTTFLYHLLGQHPLVEPAASKELHFFDALFDEGIEWYRQCFPAPRWEDGRRTITGEASPYMANRPAPERMAKVVPEARLIALLRNPVERTYSDYQMVTRKDREHKTFEEAIGLREPAEAGEARTVGKEGVNSEGEDANLDDDSEYLSRSRYAEHLLRWSEFFPREQMLVLKCEDFFDNPKQTLKVVLEFLGLPEWEPEPSKLENKRNAGRYEDDMDPETRRRLEEYFEPHNRRLYDFLGKDFGW
jgi:flagellar biosynthesis GTPase FlhF